MKKNTKISKKRIARLTNIGTNKSVRTEAIRSRREKLGMTLSEAASAAGMSNHVQWHKIESGTIIDPQISTILRMAKALRCSPMELMNWKEWKAKR